LSLVLAIDTTPLPKRRRLPSLLMVALLVTVAGAVGVLIAARRTVEAVDRVPSVAGVLSPASSNVDNYLLVGSDSREFGDPNTGETGQVSGSRSDTIMVLRYDKQSGDASLLSIPRDLYVTVPGHDGKRRINSAFNDGPDVLVRTIQTELGIPVHHYVEIDFTGFERLVEALDGVQVCFLYPTRDTNTGLNITVPGCHVLDGTQALAYARSRHYEEFREGEWREDPTSDLGRSTRQREFVNACLQESVAQLKTNPFRAGELVAAIGDAVRIDEHLDPIEAGGSLRSAVAGGLQSYALPVVPETVDGNAVLLLGDGADAVLSYFRGDGPAPAP
jgi:LCP family protein required for cell wall assembly